MNTAPAPSRRPGMGAIPSADATTFRVWAPFASNVAVAGTFNNWSETAHPLAAESSGYWSVDVAEAAVGDRYKFVIVNRDDAREYWRIDPYAREVTNSVGDGVICSPDFDWSDAIGYRTPPWHELVIYEMHLGTFNDAPGGGPGNLDRAIQRLDYLQDLGVGAIQLMPLAEFSRDFSWGYNPSHLFAVESAYGGPRALKTFIEAAHARGMAVILDIVFNHLGPDDLDLWQFDGWNLHGKGGIYFYNDWRAPTPWGDTRPDYGRPEVCQFLRDNAMMWLHEFRMDGLRWDSTINIRTRYNGTGGDIPDGWRLMQRINDEIDATSSWKISIAEDLQDNDWLTRQTSQGGAGFDSQWASNFVHPLRQAIIEQNDAYRDMHAVRDAILARDNGNSFMRVIYTESHDEVANGRSRVPEEIWPGNAGSWHSRKRSTLGAALVMTAPGIAMLFQGQEILEDQWFHDKDPIDWSRLETHSGIHALYRDLIRLRRNWYDSTSGLRGQHVNVFHLNDSDKLIGFHRWEHGGPGDDVVVLANFSNRPFSRYRIGFPRGGQWQIRFNSDWRGYGDDFSNLGGTAVNATSGGKDGLGFFADLEIGPYAVLILSQDRA
ncbi:MAG: alpha-amylase family glycosyl hydrolase [Gammaproteobacteria bacterium]